ncbi:hypothetical protein P4V86_24010 [Brevibacillus laterosporus]|uniref:Uncharacterized protein n=1 Tax=Brevibacillus laterosporus TaxID=1465 RepID=A0AAP3DG44_BRELA|nr:hypothetical protein [Brevibacillus laterosporus]ATO49929.1 hypothetical protein BrL25_13020 [Brevibacillus laterosporus DSM 25]MBG9802750.1 hypothetical protein [Brevibacillus laterosporus]MCR8980423.1 hypothetical protein [Brevibacillus laterosporus]MCZ0807578.1 hypothetical protein [Brevibacillus laterosporus]MCZ0828017.1 hypothetical protein [Brevibacillus laterosporus]
MITELEKQDFLKLQSILKPECNLFFKAVIEGTNPKDLSLLTIQTKPTSVVTRHWRISLSRKLS